MVFLLYNSSKLYFTGVYEDYNDALDKKKVFDEDTFEIVELPYWTNEEYNKKSSIPYYRDEDTNMDEDEYYRILDENSSLKDIVHKEKTRYLHLKNKLNLVILYVIIIHIYYIMYENFSSSFSKIIW